MLVAEVVYTNGIGFALRFRKSEGVFLSLIGNACLMALLCRGKGEVSHAIVQGLNSNGLFVFKLSAHRNSHPVVVCSLESYATRLTYDKMPSFGVECEVEIFGLFRFGTLYIVGVVPSLHGGVAVVSILFRGFVYGEYARKYASAVEVEHGTRVGSDLVEAAGECHNAS